MNENSTRAAKFLRCLLPVLILMILFACHPRTKENATPVPGPSPKRAAARAAMKPPTPIEALLLNLRGEQRAIGFLRPAPVSFTWYDAQGKELPAAGAEIAALVKPGNDYTLLNKTMESMAESLVQRGFARDMNNSTEIMDGLAQGSTVAVIRTTCDEAKGECILSVRIGNLKRN